MSEMNVVLPAPLEPSRPVIPGPDLGVEARERDRAAEALHDPARRDDAGLVVLLHLTADHMASRYGPGGLLRIGRKSGPDMQLQDESARTVSSLAAAGAEASP